MNKLFIMCGLPASGKTTLARELAQKEKAIVISTDKIREEFYGSEDIQGNAEKVFEKERKEKLEKLGEEIREIEAQLELAETYEQKIDVLVNYNVLDKKTLKIKI